MKDRAGTLPPRVRRGLRYLMTAVVAGAVACSGSNKGGGGFNCPTPLTGTSWVPNVPSASASNHDSSVAITTQNINSSGNLVGLQQVENLAPFLVSVPFTIGTLDA